MPIRGDSTARIGLGFGAVVVNDNNLIGEAVTIEILPIRTVRASTLLRGLLSGHVGRVGVVLRVLVVMLV